VTFELSRFRRYPVLRGRVFKGRRLSGDEAEWGVLDAVNLLLHFNDNPTHLFDYRLWPTTPPRLARKITNRLVAFHDHANDLFGTPQNPFIPADGDAPWNRVFEPRPQGGGTAPVDAIWQVVPGPAGGCYSLIAFNYPGYYLRHRNSRFQICTDDGAALMHADGTWCARTASTDVSLARKNYPFHPVRAGP
jgi:hypothetical protein